MNGALEIDGEEPTGKKRDKKAMTPLMIDLGFYWNRRDTEPGRSEAVQKR